MSFIHWMKKTEEDNSWNLGKIENSILASIFEVFIKTSKGEVKLAFICGHLGFRWEFQATG